MFAAAGDFGLSYVLEWVALVFVVLFVWRIFPTPQLARLMSARREQIRAQLSEGNEARAAAEQLVVERRAALEAARGEAASILEQARHSAASLVEEGARRAEEERARIVARAGIEIEAAHNRVRAEVISEVGALVVLAAERVVAAELDDSNQHRLIGEAIDATESEVER